MIDEITQNNFRILLPFKIAKLVEITATKNKTSYKEELIQFYKSDFYKKLEREETKYWWESPEQLYWEYTHNG